MISICQAVFQTRFNAGPTSNNTDCTGNVPLNVEYFRNMAETELGNTYSKVLSDILFAACRLFKFSCENLGTLGSTSGVPSCTGRGFPPVCILTTPPLMETSCSSAMNFRVEDATFALDFSELLFTIFEIFSLFVDFWQLWGIPFPISPQHFEHTARVFCGGDSGLRGVSQVCWSDLLYMQYSSNFSQLSHKFYSCNCHQLLPQLSVQGVQELCSLTREAFCALFGLGSGNLMIEQFKLILSIKLYLLQGTQCHTTSGAHCSWMITVLN